MRIRFPGRGEMAPRHRSKFVLVAGLACVTACSAGTVLARSQHKSETAKRHKAEDPAPPAGPLFFVVSTNKQHVSVYGRNGLYTRSPVSTGRPDHPTPHGIFTIIGKERYHESNIYSGAPMPYMQRITWSGVAMHEGVLPGYAASHGCIRMPHEFAKHLFGYTQGNERVIISRQDIVPASISHPRLPVPKLMTVPGSETVASGPQHMLQNAIALAASSRQSGGAGVFDVSVKADGAGTKPGDSGQKLLNPLEYARAMKARAAKEAGDAAAALNPARSAIEAKAKEVRQAAVEIRKAGIALSNAKERLESADRQLQKAPDNEALKIEKDEVEAKLKEAEALLASAQRAKADKEQDAANALKAFREADYVRKAAADAISSWNRRLAPVSIFISRKTQRLYIRQGFIKVFDVPVTIREPEKPLGTHLYFAMPPEEGASGTTPALRWLALTIPESSNENTGESKKRRHRHYDEDAAPRQPGPPVLASQALDRIEVPAEVQGKISEMLWAGGSLILSDRGMSDETGDQTDFVILTR